MPMATAHMSGKTTEDTAAELSLMWKAGDSGSAEKPGSREGHCSCVVNNDLYIFGGVCIENGEEIHEKGDLWKYNMGDKRWSKISPVGDEKPLSRSAATMVSVDKKLYLFGGLNQSVGWLDDFFVFDTETLIWREEDEYTGTLPSPRDKLSSAVIDHNIWYFGGFGPQATRGPLDLEDDEDNSDEDDEINRLETQQEAAQFGWFDDLHVYNTQTKSWSLPVQLSMGKPSPRCAASMVAHNKILIIFGGRDAEGRTNDTHFFDTESKKWLKDRTIKGLLPEHRSFHAACLINNHMVLAGGRGLDNQHFNDVHIFNLESNTWSKLISTGLSARGCHTLSSISGGHVVLYGGSSSFNPTLQHCDKFHSDLLISDASVLDSDTMTSKEDESSPNKMRKTE